MPNHKKPITSHRGLAIAKFIAEYDKTSEKEADRVRDCLLDKMQTDKNLSNAFVRIYLSTQLLESPALNDIEKHLRILLRNKHLYVSKSLVINASADTINNNPRQAGEYDIKVSIKR
ncbi:MAG: hypothetical protein ACI9TY_001759 [Alphaproteobacteria bacterium]|jgi:hypothetical protein